VFVLRAKSGKNIDVYDATTFNLVRRMGISALSSVLENTFISMTSCDQKTTSESHCYSIHLRCQQRQRFLLSFLCILLYLYLANEVNDHIYRLQLDGSQTKWSVKDKPAKLSVTSQFNVLVTIRTKRLLKVFTTDGKQLLKINLQSDVTNPWHSIQLSDDKFLVCHGSSSRGDIIHRVCTVNNSGHVTGFYGGPKGSADVGQLEGPCYIIVDKGGFIYVCEFYNNRVLLLSPRLEYVREILSRDQLQWTPCAGCLSADGRYLYVAVSKMNSNQGFEGGQVHVASLR